ARTLASQRQLLVLNERFLATVDPQQVLSLLADSLHSLVAYDNLTIYRVDRAAGLLRPVLARDRFASLIMESTITLDRGITGWVVTHGEAQCVNDAMQDSRISLIPGTPSEDESLIVVPLTADGMVLGTLNVGRMGGPEAYFSATEFEIARLFASQASIALVNAESHRAVATRAETDALTGLRNRRAFDDDMVGLMADPAAPPIVLVMLDLDGLKQFNDRFGHPAGDKLLRAVAEAMSASVRGDDRAYRIGGDEFAVLMRKTSLRVGMQVASRIRRAIADLDSGGGSAVAASLGVAACPEDVADPSALVSAADAALYRAKRAGGNRVDGVERLLSGRV
ncbi:MAG TPA: sensor domain-containing diguanylate cyclase, partial [Candidatus Limnocylindrales bacterium]